VTVKKLSDSIDDPYEAYRCIVDAWIIGKVKIHGLAVLSNAASVPGIF
jgi:hypothetical protein